MLDAATTDAITSDVPTGVFSAPVTAWLSAASVPKLHLAVGDVDVLAQRRAEAEAAATEVEVVPGWCDALVARAHVANLQRIEFESLSALAVFDRARPCRMCALEPALQAAFSVQDDAGWSFVTFTSQPAPVAETRRAPWRSATVSGEARVRRLAAAADLTVISTACGVAAFGVVTTFAARVLARNLRTVTLPAEVASAVTASDVDVVWGLLSEQDPVGADAAATSHTARLFNVAAAVNV
jgi:hypothetical protein